MARGTEDSTSIYRWRSQIDALSHLLRETVGHNVCVCVCVCVYLCIQKGALEPYQIIRSTLGPINSETLKTQTFHMHSLI